MNNIAKADPPSPIFLFSVGLNDVPHYCRIIGGQIWKRQGEGVKVEKNKEWHRENSKGFYDYGNGRWKYQDSEGIYHLIRDGKEIAKGKFVHFYDNGDYRYEDGKTISHHCRVIDGYVWEKLSVK